MKNLKSRISVATTLGLALAAGGFWFIVNRQNPEFKETLTGRTGGSTPLRLRSVAKKIESPMDATTVDALKPLMGIANVKAAKSKALPSEISWKQSFAQNLLVVAETGNLESTSAMISEAIRTAAGVDSVKHFLGGEEFPLEARKQVSEALMRIGSQDSVQLVLAAAIKELKLGNTEDGGSILSSLQIPVGLEGARGLLNVLLGQDGTEDISYPLPIEVRSAVQKSLRGASDSEEIGKRMAEIYSNFLDNGKEVYANVLLEEVAHPAMLGELLAKAHLQGKSDEESGLFDRLVAADDPGVVGAVARLASKEPSLLGNAAEALFDWSFNHSQYAQPGWFAEYVNNKALPPEQRVVAAYGLAGLIGKADAGRALEKAISLETEAHTQQCFQTALASLKNAADRKSENRSIQK